MSDDYISRQAVLDMLEDINNHIIDGYGYNHKWCVEWVKGLPSTQTERKRGEWRHYEGYLTCSECGTEYDDDIMTHCCDDVPKYCPNCGADMRGEQDGREG